MSYPEPLLALLIARSRAKLGSPKNLAKSSWTEMTDQQVINRFVDEFEELQPEVIGLIEALRMAREAGQQLPMEVRVRLWDRVADEAGDLYHYAIMGTDPVRLSVSRVA